MLYALSFIAGLLIGCALTGYLCRWAVADIEQIGWDW